MTEKGVNYVVGYTSLGSYGGPPTTTYSYLDLNDLKSIKKLVEPGFKLPPILIQAINDGEQIDTSQTLASVLAFGSSNVILAGNGSIVNTEFSNNDIIFLPSAVGQDDTGTTIVVSPSNAVIVGGGANDRLVIPTDRLVGFTPHDLLDYGSRPQVTGNEFDNAIDTSDTIQLVGGYWNYSKTFDQNATSDLVSSSQRALSFDSDAQASSAAFYASEYPGNNT